jgi:hypothetical protein
VTRDLEDKIARLRPGARRRIEELIDGLRGGGEVACPLCGHVAVDGDDLRGHVDVEHPATYRFSMDALRAAAGPLTDGELAERFGVTRRTVLRWKRRCLDEWRADRWSIALGLHPSSVWPDWSS